MRLLLSTARWEGLFLISSFAVVTLWRLLKSASFDGLLRASDGTFSPGRIQMLMLTVLTAMQYLLAIIHDPSHFPALPPNLVATMGGSQAVYLGAKAWTMLGPKANSQEDQ